MENWRGYDLEKRELFGREVIIVYPKKPNGRWALKTEYFDAFPEVELELLSLGYHIFHIKNITRWHKDEDTEARAKLAEYVQQEMGLSKKCVIVGMSCGGMQGIYFGAKYPEFVSCMYLDAPVVNLLSCPAGLGKGSNEDFKEFEEHKGIDFMQLLSYREHPLDYIPRLVQNNIPVVLVSGDSDSIVPFEENGKLLKNAYLENGCTIKTIIKEGADHHPHGLGDNTPIIDFIKEYDKD